MKRINAMKRIWSVGSAIDYIRKVINGNGVRGLTFLSACDFLKLDPKEL